MKTKDKRVEVTAFLVGVDGHIRDADIQKNKYLVRKFMCFIGVIRVSW